MTSQENSGRRETGLAYTPAWCLCQRTCHTGMEGGTTGYSSWLCLGAKGVWVQGMESPRGPSVNMYVTHDAH